MSHNPFFRQLWGAVVAVGLIAVAMPALAGKISLGEHEFTLPDGFTIERTYYSLDGTEANVTEVAQNERFVVVQRVREENVWPSRVLVSDLLPAGFEIDNPRLVSSADLANFPWLARTEAAHLEFRDDRFVAAFNREPGSDRNITLAYVVRAVTPGLFAHPAASVEDMYRPQYSARTPTGMMAVNGL